MAYEPPTPYSDDDLAKIQTRVEFGHELTLLRQRAGLTVRDVAKAVGVPDSTIGGYFSGAHLPPLKPPDLLRKILHACGVTDPAVVEQWTRVLTRVRRAPGPRPAGAPVPYRGLASFQPEDAKWFYGREQLTTQLVAHAATAATTGGLLTVVGPSGSGKSSLLRAGLLAALRAGADGTAGLADQRVLLFTPGARPLRVLAQQIAELTGDDTSAVATVLQSDPHACAGLLRRPLQAGNARPAESTSRHPAGQPVIIVDQFEETFTACDDEDERRAFVAALATAAESPPADGSAAAAPVRARPAAVVVIGLRADFYTHALRYPQLAAALQAMQVVVAGMSAAQLRDAVVGPARRAKLDIDDALVELLLRELAPTDDGASRTAHDAGALPLLSHALLATWERGHRARLTVADYRDSGGIRGAVARTAEEAYAELDPVRQELARRMFLRLVHIADDAADTRRYVPHAELRLLGGDIQLVLDTFIRRRLITADAERVEITHEALLAAWPRLRGWIDNDRAGLRTHRQLTTAAESWQDLERDRHALYRGGRLAIASEWASDPAHRADLNPLEREFLDASIAYDLAEQRAARRRTRRLQQLLVASTVLLLASGLLAGYAFQQRAAADEQRNLAVARQIATVAAQVRAKDVSLAMQLSLVAYRIAAVPESRSSLLDSFATPAVTRMLGPAGVMQSIAFTADGKIMAAGGTDKTVQLWDLSRPGHPRPVGTSMPGHTDTIYALAFSPDGRTLASGSGDKTIRIWDVTDPARAHPLGSPITGPENTVYALAFSPDGHTLAAGSADKTVRLWNLTEPSGPVALGAPLTGPAGFVQSVAFSPDGHTLAAGSADKSVRLWNVEHPGAPVPLASPLTGPTRTVYSVAFSPDGHALAAGSADGTVTLWDTSDPTRPVSSSVLTGPTSWVNSVAFSPDGQHLAGASSDSKVWIWDTTTRSVATVLPHPAPLTAVVFPGGASNTVATSAADGTARLWRIPGPVMAGSTASVFTTSFGDNHRLAVAAADNAAELWDVSEPRRPVMPGRPISNLNVPGPASGAAALSPDGRTLASGGVDGTVQLWDVSDPARAVPTPGPLAAHTEDIQAIAFSPDGRILATASNDKTVSLWDVSDPRRPARLHPNLTGAGNYVLSVAFSPDGHTLAAGGADNTVRLWDITNPAAPASLGPPLTGPTNYVYAVAFSPDGHTLAAGSADNTVRLFDVTRPGRPVPVGRPLTGPDNYVYSVAFSPDGHLLAAGGGDGTVWLWSMTDRHRPQTYATITGHDKSVFVVAFDTGRGILASGSADKTVRVWNTDPDQVAAYVCATAGAPITPAEWTKYVPNVPYRPPCGS